VNARSVEDRRDADAFRILFYTGLRLGEVLALRWEDVDLKDRLVLVRRAVSAGVETLPKGRQHRFVPLAGPAVTTFAKLSDRAEFTGPDDYVLCNRWGRRIDPSALRRRYKRGCEAAGLRPVKLHRPAPRCWQPSRTHRRPRVRPRLLGPRQALHTDRYVSAKLRPEEFKRLDDAFAPVSLSASALAGAAGGPDR